jgi:hypothetical protein
MLFKKMLPLTTKFIVRRVRKIAKKRILASCLSVSLSVHMEQIGYHLNDFH